MIRTFLKPARVVSSVRTLSTLTASERIFFRFPMTTTTNFASLIQLDLRNFSPITVRRFAKKAGKSKNDDNDDDDDRPSSSASSSSGAFDIKSMEQEMNDVTQRFAKDLTGLRGNRASPDILHKVVIKKNDGSTVPILKVAQITVKDPKTLLVSVFDEANVGVVQNAITNANLGLSPSTLGASSLIVAIPKMSQEYREKLQKMINQMEEDAKQRVRRIRGDAVKHVKKVTTSKDDVRRLETSVQNSTESFNKKLASMAQEKLKEISTN